MNNDLQGVDASDVFDVNRERDYPGLSSHHRRQIATFRKGSDWWTHGTEQSANHTYDRGCMRVTAASALVPLKGYKLSVY